MMLVLRVLSWWVYKQSRGNVEASERGLRLLPTILQKNRICWRKEKHTDNIGIAFFFWPAKKFMPLTLLCYHNL